MLFYADQRDYWCLLNWDFFDSDPAEFVPTLLMNLRFRLNVVASVWFNTTRALLRHLLRVRCWVCVGTGSALREEERAINAAKIAEKAARLAAEAAGATAEEACAAGAAAGAAAAEKSTTASKLKVAAAAAGGGNDDDEDDDGDDCDSDEGDEGEDH